MANIKLNANGAKTPIQVRTGVDVPYLGGLRPDVDPIALRKNDFVNLVNVRRIGGAIVGRPGQELINELPYSFGLLLGDIPIGANRRLMVITDGCPGYDSGLGKSLGSYTEEQLPRFQPLVYRAAAVQALTHCRYRRGSDIDSLLPEMDALVFSVDGVFYRLANIPFMYGTAALAQTNGSQEVPIWTIPSTYAVIHAMLQHGSTLILSVAGPGTGVGTSAVFTWNSVTFVRELDAIDPILGFGNFRDRMIAIGNGTTNLIRVRSSAGAWTTVAPSAGTVKVEGNHRCASYKDKFWIPSGDTDLFVYDGTTLTRVPLGTTGVSATAKIHGVESAFGYLFFTWTDAGGACWIGRYDGTTWAPFHKNILAQFPAATDVRGIRLFAGALMVAGIDDGLAVLFRSDRRNTNGTYTTIIPASSNNTGAVRELSLY